MRQLRTHLSEELFVERVGRQMQGGYQLAVATDGDLVVGCAGFRVDENLAWSRHIYVDDLVTASTHRGLGVGRAIMEWLVAYGRAHDCAELHLDSGVQRHAAHAFYLSRGMRISSHHFALELGD